MRYIAGLDLGGTHIVCGLLDLQGKLLGVKQRATEAERGAEDVLTRMASMVREMMDERGESLDDIAVVGAGIPGLVDPLAGVSVQASNLQWSNVPAAGRLAQLLGLTVFIDNDVKMYVYGEAVAGAGRNDRHVLGVTIGTGIASAMVNEGRLYYGSHFQAGEFGHTPLEGNDLPCKCGLRGCLETVVSATGIANQAKRAIRGGRSSMLTDLAGDAERLTASDISAAYDRGDALAREIMDYSGAVLGRSLAMAVHLLSPDVVIVGGGGAKAGERLLRPLKETLYDNMHLRFRGRVRVELARHVEEAGVIGSALSAYRRLAQTKTDGRILS